VRPLMGRVRGITELASGHRPGRCIRAGFRRHSMIPNKSRN
jgi:hypothetical protein